MRAKSRLAWTRKLLSLIFAALACLVFVLYLSAPENASAEYRYTVQKIFQFCFLPLALLWTGCNYPLIKKIAARVGIGWPHLCAAGLLLLAVPFLAPPVSTLDWRIGLCLSVCWMLGMLFLSFGFFLLAARLDNAVSGVLCLFASLALAWFAGEATYLLTPQTGDGRWSDPDHSKYVLAHMAEARAPATDDGEGFFPKRPPNATGAGVQREMRYGDVLFDVIYTLDDHNRRITPPADPHPAADLMLFGCSFTFGHGLDDDRTWPWLLAKDLGPSWKVDNYAYSGFGAQQMLFILEGKKIEAPKAPIRQALFLAIHDQIRRNAGFFEYNSVSYALDGAGKLERAGMTRDSPWQIFFRVPRFFNGSQLAREISIMGMRFFMGRSEQKNTKTYLAIIGESARILREQYATTLSVLLWPDAEYLAPELGKMGIPVIMARGMLGAWEKEGERYYQIVPEYETHPNARAARELAAGLARHYRNLAEAAASPSGGS